MPMYLLGRVFIEFELIDTRWYKRYNVKAIIIVLRNNPFKAERGCKGSRALQSRRWRGTRQVPLSPGTARPHLILGTLSGSHDGRAYR